jgi:hypothetical protein
VEKPQERDHLEDPDIWEDNIKVDLKEDGSMWTIFIRLVVGREGIP